ncbi:hypothetical protein, partial [Halorussus sp. GCM10023401]|uniref:hypothetical protein n=1 Tax=Halorussus sp. GCM10023401 TaxID=3252680 RepID=UPI0036174314
PRSASDSGPGATTPSRFAPRSTRWRATNCSKPRTWSSESSPGGPRRTRPARSSGPTSTPPTRSTSATISTRLRCRRS